MLARVEWDGGDVSVYGDGSLVARRTGTGEERHVLAPTIEPRTKAPCVASKDGSAAMVGLEGDDTILHLDAASPGVRRILLGERIPNAWQLEVFAIAEGFLVRYERGLVCVSTRGRERWRTEGVTFDWRFVDERDGAVWLEDESGNLVGFDVATGVECT